MRNNGPRTMSVRELIGLLENVPEDQQDTPVLFACDYGDYHHTTQTLGISDMTDEPETIRPEAYSQSGWGMMSEREKERLEQERLESDEGPDLDEDEEEEGPKAFILS